MRASLARTQVYRLLIVAIAVVSLSASPIFAFGDVFDASEPILQPAEVSPSAATLVPENWDGVIPAGYHLVALTPAPGTETRLQPQAVLIPSSSRASPEAAALLSAAGIADDSLAAASEEGGSDEEPAVVALALPLGPYMGDIDPIAEDSTDNLENDDDDIDSLEIDDGDDSVEPAASVAGRAPRATSAAAAVASSAAVAAHSMPVSARPAPVAAAQGSDVTFLISGGADRSAGFVGTVLISIANVPIGLTRLDIVTIAFPPKTWRFTTYLQPSPSRCTFSSATVAGLSSPLIPHFADNLSLQTTKDVPANDGRLNIECTNVRYPEMSVKAGVNDGTPIVRINRKENILFSREFGTYSSVYNVHPAEIGALFRKFTFDEYGQLAVIFTLPFGVFEDESFYLSLHSSWYKAGQSPNCSINLTPARKTEFALEGDRAVIRASLPRNLQPASASSVLLFSCGRITAPPSGAAQQAVFSLMTALNGGKTRASTDKLDIPALDSSIAASLFDSSFAKLLTGVNTTMSVAVRRVPRPLESGSIITIKLPNDILVTEESECEVAQYPGDGFVDQSTIFKSIESTTSITLDGELEITLKDTITPAVIITRFNCVGVTPTVAYPSRQVISLTATPATGGGEPMTKNGGRIPTITASEMGSDNRVAAMSSARAGAIGEITVEVRPIAVTLVKGDSVTLALDSRFAFTTTSRCTMTASNDGTNYLNQGGDVNVMIETQTTFSNAASYRVVLKITENRDRELALIYRHDSSIKMQCTEVKNPPHETAGLSSVSVTTTNFDMKTKAKFSDAILTQIEPGLLGETIRRIHHSAPWLNQVGVLTVSISEIRNGVPSAFEGGRIEFQMPLSWSFNAMLQATVCTVSGNYPSGTTKILSGYMHHTISFAPNSGLPRGSYTLTCTNVKAPSQTERERTDLSITTFKDNLRIEVQTNAILTEVYAQRPPNFVRASVLHNLIFQRGSQLSSSERAVYLNIYNDVGVALQCSSEMRRQTLHNIAGFQPPGRVTEVIAKGALDPPSLGDDGGNGVHRPPSEELSLLLTDQGWERVDAVDDWLALNDIVDEDEPSDDDGAGVTPADRAESAFALPTGREVRPRSGKYLVVATWVNTTNPEITASDIAHHLTTQFATLQQRIYSSLGMRVVDLVPDNGEDGDYPPSCFDGILGDSETDVDCGGPDCPKCTGGKDCLRGADCRAGLCSNNVCAASSAFRGVPTSSLALAVATSVAALAVSLWIVRGPIKGQRDE